MSALLVSVRNAAEAEEALAGGAALIDVKEPGRGALGAADPEVIAGVVRAVGGRRPVSVALGECRELNARQLPVDREQRIAFLKAGLSHVSGLCDWRESLLHLRETLVKGLRAELVAVAYADWSLAGAPPVYDVLEFALTNRFAALLIDTWTKDGRSLLDWLPATELTRYCQRCRATGVRTALAGSLDEEQIRTLLPACPDWFAVRGAACVGGRSGAVSRDRVAALVDVFLQPC